MADKFAFGGSFTTSPLIGSPSFAQACAAPIDELLVLKNWKRTVIELTSDSPVTVSLDQIASAHVLILKVVEGGPKAIATLSSADGAAQAFPFDYAILSCQTVPYDAVSLTRVSGTATKVEVFIGEKA